MVAARNRLLVGVVVKRTIGGSSVRRGDSGSGHVGVVTWAVVVSTRSKSSVARGGGGNSGNFRITKLVVVLLALPELGTRAASVVVGRSRPVALLLLVVASEKDLDRDGDEEKKSGRN